MNKAKIIAALFLSLVLITVCIPAQAADSPVITLSNKAALPGETVAVDISISNNPGIMAMAFCITYDSSIFEYTGYTRGYLSRYTIKDHSDKGHIAVVNDESSDKSNNGNIISVTFKIKDNAAPGKYEITLANINREKYGYALNNSFSNSNQKYVVPAVTAGSITVNESCENAGHKYGDWQIITPADCTREGIRKHSCIRCGYSETEEIPITHDFEDEWTVDKAATPEEDGIMSRHCKKCDAVTDQITFTYKETHGGTSSDESSSQNTSSGNNTSIGTSSGTAASGGTDSANDPSGKTAIDNTLGAKNPLSAVENTKDYQQNIKPNLPKDDTPSDTNGNNSSSNSESSNTESSKTETATPSNQDNNNNNTNAMSPMNIIFLIVSAILSAAIIAVAVILIIKRKKAE